MKEHMMTITNQIKLWCKTSGNIENPAILFIEGAGASSANLRTEVLRNALNKNYYTIQFNYRDVGLSTWYNFDEHPYTLLDMVNDIIQLLKSLKIKKVHIIGSSLGGYIAQLLAIDYPTFVLSLILLSSTCDLSSTIKAVTGQTIKKITLPPPTPTVINMLSACLNSKTDEEIFENQLNYGTISKNEEEQYRALLPSIKKHPHNPKAGQNHLKAILATDASYLYTTEKLHKIHVPTLIIHGAHDPLFPVIHGKTIANGIKNAKLHIIKDMGHFIEPRFFEELLVIITKFLHN